MHQDPEELRRRLESDPADQVAFTSLRAVYSDGGHHEALAELLEYRATYGTYGEEAADLFLSAAELWLDRLADTERGAAALTRAIDKHPTHRKAGDRLDAFYREQGDTAALVQLLEQRIEALEAQDPGASTSPLRAHFHQQLGEVWEQSYGRQDQAITHFRRAFELDPTNVMALYCAREIYQSAGNHETAAKLLDLEARAEKDASRRVALYRELAHARAERLGDLEGSVVSLKRALALDPSSPDVMGELALMLLRRAPMGGGDDDRARAADLLFQIASQSDPETALGYCEATLDAWPEHEEALDLFEEHCHGLTRTDLLVDRYRRLVESMAQSPNVWVIYRKLGTLAHQLGDFDEAISCFEALETLGDAQDHKTLEELYRATGRAADLARLMSGELVAQAGGGLPADPTALPRLRELVALLRAEGKDEEAEARMLEILGLAPGDPDATAYLERRYRARGDWQGLYALVLQAGQNQELPAAGRVVRLREAAGIAEERLHDSDGAIAAYSLAAVLDPDEAELRRQLERLLTANERWDELVDRMEAEGARASTPRDKIDALHRIAEMHSIRRGDLESASDTYRRILELQPDDLGALEALDEIYLRQGDWDNLIDVLKRRVGSTAINAEKASLDLRIGAILHEQLDRPEEAYEACERALQEVPDKGPALARMEAIDTISGNWARLLQTLKYRSDLATADERASLVARAANLAADRLGDNDQAAELWRNLVDLDPEDTAALSSLAACLEAVGSWQEALDTLRRLAEVSHTPEEQLDVRRRIARALEEKGDRVEAAAAWQEIVDRADDPEALSALASHHEFAGQHGALVELLVRLEGLLLEDPAARRDAMLRRARALSGPLGKPDEAVETLETLLDEVDGASREALEELRQIHVSRGEFRPAAEAAERELDLIEDVAARTDLLLQCASWYRTELDDPAKAIESNEKVLELDPYRSDVIAALEELYVETEDWERLLRLTRARYKATNDQEQCQRLLLAGAEICEHKLDDGQRAWGWYREIFDRVGDQAEVLATVEAAAERLGLGLELIDVYGELTRAASTDLEQAQWWKKIGSVYAEWIGDHERALEAVLRGFALDPEDQELLGTIDELALKAGAHDRLVSVYQALLERDSAPEAQVALRRRLATVMLGEGGRPSEAFDQLLEALEQIPDDTEVLRQVEVAARASGRWEDLLDLYETHRDFAHDPKERLDLLLRAAKIIEENLSAPDRAFALLTDALTLAPEDEELVTEAIGVVERLEAKAPGDRKGLLWRRLVSFFKDLVRQAEEDAEEQVRYLDRIALIEEDHLFDGRAAFDTCRQATLLLPGHTRSLDMLERLAGGHQLWRELATHYASALEVVLDRAAAVDLHRRRARVLTDKLDRGGDAVEHYWQLIQIDSGDNDSRRALAAIFTDGARWNDLIMLLERELPNADAARKLEILLEIASIWEKQLANAYEAQDAYRRVLAAYPDNGDAREAMERLSKPMATAGALDDEALAELGLLDDASAPPPAFSTVPEDYLTAGVDETEDIELPEDAEVLPPVVEKEPETEAEAVPAASGELTEVIEAEPDFDHGPGGMQIEAPANPDSTSEIDVSQVEEVIDALDDLEEDLAEEVDIEDLEMEELDEVSREDATEARPSGPPPVPSKPPPTPPGASSPSGPPPIPKK